MTHPNKCNGCTGIRCNQARNPELCDCGFINPIDDSVIDAWTWVDDLVNAAWIAAGSGIAAVVLGIAAGYLFSSF